MKKSLVADEAMKTQIDTRGMASEIVRFANTNVEAQLEIGARIDPDEGKQAEKFMRQCPDYFPDDRNYAMLREYLRSRALPFTAQALREAWKSLRANGKAILSRTQKPDAPMSFENLSSQEIEGAMQGIRDLSRQRRERVKRIMREPLAQKSKGE